MSTVADLFDRQSCGSAAGAATHARAGEAMCAECLEAFNEIDRSRGRPRTDRRQVVERMKALDQHRAARAALREQTRAKP